PIPDFHRRDDAHAGRTSKPPQAREGVAADMPAGCRGSALFIRALGAAGLVRFLRVAGAVRTRAETSQALQGHLVTVVAVQQTAFHARDRCGAGSRFLLDPAISIAAPQHAGY